MKILLPVSADPFFKDALALAVDVATARNAEILAVCVIDQSEIRRIAGGGGLGAIHMAQHAAEEFEQRKMAEAAEALLFITQFCANAGVVAHGDIRGGELIEEFLASAGGCDLVVGSIGSQFKPGTEDKPGKLVLKMMRDGGIPVLLACTPYRPVRVVLIGCGGGLRSERAVAAMIKLSLWKSGCRRILLAVDDLPENGEKRLAAPRNLLADAGYDLWETLVVKGRKQEVFSDVCETEKADVVVLGGWGERRWDDLMGLSVTGRLLSEGRRNLFLYM